MGNKVGFSPILHPGLDLLGVHLLCKVHVHESPELLLILLSPLLVLVKLFGCSIHHTEYCWVIVCQVLPRHIPGIIGDPVGSRVLRCPLDVEMHVLLEPGVQLLLLNAHLLGPGGTLPAPTSTTFWIAICSNVLLFKILKYVSV